MLWEATADDRTIATINDAGKHDYAYYMKQILQGNNPSPSVSATSGGTSKTTTALSTATSTPSSTPIVISPNGSCGLVGSSFYTCPSGQCCSKYG